MALLCGFAAIAVVAMLSAVVLLAWVAWPITLLGACMAVGIWLVQRPRERPVVMPPAAALSGAIQVPRPADELPQSARERIDRIRQKAAALAGSPGSSKDRYLVQSTLDDYLPGAVEAYLSLPPGSADWPATPEGRTGLEMLHDQLDLLERTLDRIAGHVWQAGTQRLLAHERFLEERLAGHTEDLDIRR